MTEPSFHWFLPMRGDSRFFGGDTRPRPVDRDYLGDVARAAERNGFESMLIATAHGSGDTWLNAAAAAAATERIRFIVAFRAGYSLPTLVSQQVESFAALYDDRIDINVVTGSDVAEQAAYGDPVDKALRYERTAEFMDILRREFSGERYDFHGAHYDIQGGGRPRPLRRSPVFFFGGLSDESTEVGARFADVQLMYGETPLMVRDHVERVGEAADRHGRKVRFGIRIQVISRDTHDEAVAETERFLARLTPEQVTAAQARLAERASLGQQRVQSLNPGRIEADALWPHPGVWSGLGLVGGGGGSTALVGSHDEVAQSIEDYRTAGISHFILSGAPLLEESYTVGENVLPLLRGVTAPVQEVVA